MSYSLNSSSSDPRPEQLRAQHARQRTRFFITFAVIEGIVLAAAVIAVYVLELVDPEVGVWIIVVVAALCALAMSTGIMRMIRRQAQESRDVGGY